MCGSPTVSYVSDAEEGISEIASDYQTSASVSQASEAWVGSIDPICALAAASKSSLYCAANEDGVVNLFDNSRGKLHELMRSLNFLALSHLTWSEDAKHIAAADFGGNITVKCLRSSPSKAVKGGFQVQSILAAKPKADFGGIRQLLLNVHSTKLFVLGQELVQTWSLETGRIKSTSTIEDGTSCTWINHPLQEDLLIGISPNELMILRWKDLSEVSRFQLRGNASRFLGRSSFDAEESQDASLAQLTLTSRDQYHLDSFVSKAMLTQDAEHVLVQISESSIQGKCTKGVVVLKVSSLEQSPTNMALDTLHVPRAILKNIEVPLGILAGGRLVFLDHDLWMCTFKLYSGDTSGLKRHFFIPRDWASTDALEQCCMLDDGTFLSPKRRRGGGHHQRSGHS